MLRIRRHSRRKVFIWSIMALCVMAALGGYGWYRWQPTQPTAQLSIVQSPPRAPRPQALTSRVLFMGDVYWGRYINQWSQASPLKQAYPFSGLSGFHREQYNAWIADLECPVVAGVNLTPDYEESTLSFNCSPTYLSEAAKWFTAFSDANNHSDNRDQQVGLDETRRHLDEHSIQYFGHFDPDKLEDVCEVISLPIKVTLDNGRGQAGNLPIAMCGYHGVFKIPSPASVAMMQRYSALMPTFAYPHMGKEYQPAPDEIRTTLFHSMIDAGADAVLGDHPHWVQNAEAYKGRPIFYSMGNFIFDQQTQPETTRSAPVDLTLAVDKKADPDQMQAWLKLGEGCKTFKDDCLSQAEAQHLQRLPFTFSFAVQPSYDYPKLTHPADAAQAQAIMQRLQWPQLKAGLRAPYSAQ